MPATPAKQIVDKLLSRGHARFLVDTSFLLHERSMDALEKTIIAYLHSSNCPLVVPYAVQCELVKHSKSDKDSNLAINAVRVLEVLWVRKKNGQVRLIGHPDEKFADQTFLEVFTRFRVKYDLMLFTNDKGLCRDLLRLNDTESTSRCSNEIWISWHNGDKLLAARHVNDMAHKPTLLRKTASRRMEPLFKKCVTPRALENKLVGGREKLIESNTVCTQKGESFRLGKLLAAGGEGEIFVIDDNRVAKIYFPDRRTNWRAEKLSLMAVKKVALDHVNWPQECLYSNDNNFVGYMMPFAKGIPLQHAVFGKATIQEKFPLWNRLNLVRLARTVAQTVGSLNDLGVIVGDLNPMNLLIVGDSEVHLVDVDSVQIEDFPCPVGMANFRAPEITESSFEKFLRDDQHEAFALATMLFMILMGGKPPFSFQGGGDPAENIRKGNFPYVTDHGLIPAGAYRYIWSFFPNSVKNAFAAAFTGKDPTSRPSASRWVEILTGYCNELERTTIADSLEIWPSSFRPWDNKNLVQLRCAECSSVFQTSSKDADKRKMFPKILCNTCVTVLALAKKAGQNHTCKKCGQLFQVGFHEVQKHGDTLELCQKCVAEVASLPRVCKVCGRTFTLDTGETRYMLVKKLRLPKRCGPCREKTATVNQPVKPQPVKPQPVKPQPQPQQPRIVNSTKPTPSPLPQSSKNEPSIWDMFKSFFG